MNRATIPLTLSLALAASLVQSQELPKTDPPLERYYQYPLINGRSPAAPAMSPDGSKIVYGWNQTGERRLDVWIMDYPSGRQKMIVDARKIEALPRQDDTRSDLEKKEETLYDAGIAGFQWAPDGKQILFNYRGRTWFVDPDGKNLDPLFDANMGAGSAQFSPDNKYVGYLSGGNLYRMDRKNGRIKQLTFISKPNTSVDSFVWSPDGKNIVVTWSDSSKLGSHVMMDFSKDRATVVNIRRQWTGEKSANVQVGVVSADGGLIKFLEGLPRYLWLKDIDWAPDGSTFSVAWMKEDFQEFNISVVPVSTLKTATVYTEKAPKNYIPDWRPVAWSRDSRSIIFGTDIHDGKFGWRSVKRMTPSGRDIQNVYAKDHDVVSLMRPKNSDRLILTTMAHSPLTSEITIVEPLGGQPKTIAFAGGMTTPKNFDEAGSPLVSDDGTKIASMCSSRTLPWELYAIEPQYKRLTYSQPEEFKKIQWAEHRQVTFTVPDGRTVYGVLITKPGLDKSKKHPAFISSMYANSAKMAWNGFFENYAAMELDMVVLQVDFRSSWGLGGEFNSGYYKSMGIVDAEEAVAAKKYLDSLGYVREDRVGLWGWSYGGFLTEMVLFQHPDVFHAGVAVAPVTDWRSYNEWYTRRRLSLDADDKEAYKKTSPITYGEKLNDHLLMVHGMLDDNVLFQDTARMMQKLIENGKYFEVMMYPRDDHGIGKDTSRPHVFVTVMRYLYSKLVQP